MKPMPYLNLQLSRPEGDLLFRKSFGAERFAPLVEHVTALLVRGKAVTPGQACRARIIPRSDDHPNFERAAVLALPNDEDDGLGDLGIAFESKPAPDEPLTYLTLSLSNPETQAVYRFDLPLDTFYDGDVAGAVQQLLDQDIIKDGERFRVDIFAQEEGTLEEGVSKTRKLFRWGQKLSSLAAKVRVEYTEPFTAAAELSLPAPAPEEEEEEPDIVIGDVVQLVRPEPRSMKSYTNVEAVGQPAEQDIPVFIRREAMERARKSAGLSARSNEEVGGFFIGSVFCDPEGDRTFVDISETVETDRARGTLVSLEFNYEAWRQVLDRIEGDIRDKHLMGWYHTHLVSHATAEPVEGAPGEYVARYQAFFSSHDRFIHKHFFPSAWHVGLVLDLRCKKEVFFAWKSGEIDATQGFYLYD